MATLIALAAIGLSAAGAVAAIVAVASVAIRREEKNLTLTSPATGSVTRLARRLTGAYARVPPRGAARPVTGPRMRLP